jgi:hypothetical protein
LAVAQLESFQLAAYDRRQPEITLARLKYHFATPNDAARPDGIQHGELLIVELWECDALRIAVELLVILKFGHKFR